MRTKPSQIICPGHTSVKFPAVMVETGTDTEDNLAALPDEVSSDEAQNNKHQNRSNFFQQQYLRLSDFFEGNISENAKRQRIDVATGDSYPALLNSEESQPQVDTKDGELAEDDGLL